MTLIEYVCCRGVLFVIEVGIVDPNAFISGRIPYGDVLVQVFGVLVEQVFKVSVCEHGFILPRVSSPAGSGLC